MSMNNQEVREAMQLQINAIKEIWNANTATR